MFRILLGIIILGLVISFWKYLLGIAILVIIGICIKMIFFQKKTNQDSQKENSIQHSLDDNFNNNLKNTNIFQAEKNKKTSSHIKSDDSSNKLTLCNSDKEVVIERPLLDNEIQNNASKTIIGKIKSFNSPSTDVIEGFKLPDNPPTHINSNFNTLDDSIQQYANGKTENIVTPEKCWIPSGTSVTIQGYVVADGMVFVGRGLKGANQYETEVALINPNLPIQKFSSDYINRHIGYWPAYYRITPAEKASYLAWLAGGKQDPEADIGYVFLYFYGLERRLLYDIPNDPSLQSESEVIQNELKRLLSIYSNNVSFRTYVNQLLSYVVTNDYENSIVYNNEPPEPSYHQGVPAFLSIGIAQMARDQVPIPSDWALNWYLSTYDPPIYSRTAAQRCYAEFKTLFAQKYKNKFADGVKLKPNKTMLSFEYHPASASLNSKTYQKQTTLPDITRTKTTLNRLSPLIQECHDELDRYSRFLGRNPDKKDTIDALLELSPSLWSDNILEKFKQLSNKCNSDKLFTPLKFSELLNQLPAWNKITKTKLENFLSIVDAYFDIGIEPDCRINGKVPSPDSIIILFSQPKQFNLENLTGPKYSFATLILHLNLLLSQVDGQVSEDELELIMTKIDHFTWIDNDSKPRLKAHALWLNSQELKITNMKKRIEILDSSQKELIGNLLVQVAKVDGTVSLEEMKLLEKLFKLLDLNTSSLFNQINKSEFEPITVSKNIDSPNEFSIKEPIKKDSSQININTDKLASLKEDSEKVSNLLKEIFVDEDEQTHSLSTTPNTQNSLLNLPGGLANFTSILISKMTWTIAELEELAQMHQLMLEGTLEEINDASFDKFDEPLIEEIDNGFEINQDVVEELKNE